MTIRRGDILWADLGMFPTTSVQSGVILWSQYSAMNALQIKKIGER